VGLSAKSVAAWITGIQRGGWMVATLQRAKSACGQGPRPYLACFVGLEGSAHAINGFAAWITAIQRGGCWVEHCSALRRHVVKGTGRGWLGALDFRGLNTLRMPSEKNVHGWTTAMDVGLLCRA